LIGNIDVAEEVFCDSCVIQPLPWRRGVAALSYLETGRALVLALKQGDCHDIVRPSAKWMAQASGCLVQANKLVVPVPLHWTRHVRRPYNQAGLLSTALAKRLGLPHCVDLLVRRSRTRSLEGCSTNQHFAIVQAAIQRNPRHKKRWLDRPVLLVDYVMTSGATLSVATKALQKNGNYDVYTCVLARVEKQI
jgi:predicted amidophosphoribosyltransferase